MNATHELQQETFLDDFVAIHCWCNTFNETRINVIRVDHGLQLFELGLGEGLDESLPAFVPDFFFTSNVCASLKMCQKRGML